jgi:hypothetical protein
MKCLNKLIKSFVLIIFFLQSSSAYSQDQVFENWVKAAFEVKLNFENRPWEIRWRPDDHVFLPESYKQFLPKTSIARMDFMVGYNYKDLRLSSYSKFDEFGAIWTGLRFDYNLFLLEKKLLFNIQERVFFGLNDKSENHYYLIQYFTYNGIKNIQTGFFGFGKFEFNWPYKENTEKIPFTDAHWFMGPTINFDLPWHLSLQTAFCKSIFYDHTYMTYLKMGYKIKIKDKRKEKESDN